MAEPNPQRGVTAAFPPPPPFWKHFTPQNLSKLEQLKEEALEKGEGSKGHRRNWSPEALRALELPPELRYLVPPEPPTSGSFSLFGELQTISTTLPSLQEQGIEQLYPSSLDESDCDSAGPSKPSNHAYYLLKISKSLLLNFLELVGLLSIQPERFEPKLADIRNLFINAHHLLNLYRPHQARESLILMMEEQLQRSRKEIQEMDRVKARVQAFLQELEAEGRETAVIDGDGLPKPASIESRPQDKQDRNAGRAQEMWELLDDIDPT